jgi:hypothetical protein
MNCQESQHTMDQQIAALVISEEASRELQKHLTECSGCADRHDELCEVDTFITANADICDPNPFLWTRIATRLEENPRLPESGWVEAVFRWPLLTYTWAKQRQLAASLCMLVLLISALIINQQSLYFEKTQLLGQIDRYAAQLAGTAGNENPFPLDLSATTIGSDNPFPVLPEINVDKNPFEDVKS